MRHNPPRGPGVYPRGPGTHDQVLLLPVDLHCVDGVDSRFLRGLPGVLAQRKESPEGAGLEAAPREGGEGGGAAAGAASPCLGAQTLTPRRRPRKACRKVDLPTARAPTTLHRRTFLCVCPFSWSSLFSRVTVDRRQGVTEGDRGGCGEGPGLGRRQMPTCDGVDLGVLLAERGVTQVTKMLETAPDIQVGHQAGGWEGREGREARGHCQAHGGRGGTHVHWQRYPRRGSRPASVGTSRGSREPQGAAGNTLKKLSSSAGERLPSWSCRQRGCGDTRLVAGGRRGARRKPRHPHLIVLLKHPLQKLVAEVVELGAAAGGHVEPVGGAGAVRFPGCSLHLPCPGPGAPTPSPPVERTVSALPSQAASSWQDSAKASHPSRSRGPPRRVEEPPGTGLTQEEPQAPSGTHGGSR